MEALDQTSDPQAVRLMALGHSLSAEQARFELDTRDLERVRRHVVELPAEPETALRWWSNWRIWGATGATAVAVGVLVVLGMGWNEGRGELTYTIGTSPLPGPVAEWISAPPAGIPLRFSDGTEVHLERNTRARVLELQKTGAHVAIESGRARLQVVSRKGSSFRLSLGPFRVDVKGTMFDVAWHPDRDWFELTLHEGKVVLSGCVFEGGRGVSAGQTIRASCNQKKVEITRDTTSQRLDSAEPEQLGEDDGAEELAPSDLNVAKSSSPAVTRERSWSALARRGDYASAFRAAEAVGFERLCSEVSGGELMLLADSARLSGHTGDAERAYRMARQRFAGQNQAKLAAFSLGRMAFDQQGDPARAAQWLSAYLREDPGGQFAREALGRLMEALQQSGDTEGAARSARRYLKLYPSGPHARVANELSRAEPR